MEEQYPDWWCQGKGSMQTPSQGASNLGTTTTAASTLQGNSAVMSANNMNAPQCLAFSTLAGAPGPLVTYADSVANQHFFADRADFKTYGPPGMDDRVGSTMNKGDNFCITGTGCVRKWVLHEGKIVKLMFKNMLHMQEFTHNLVSISRLCRKGCRMLFDLNRAVFYAPNGAPFMSAALVADTMFHINFVEPPL